MEANLKRYIEDYSRQIVDDTGLSVFRFYLRDGYLNAFLTLDLTAILPDTLNTAGVQNKICIDRLCNYTKIGSYADYKNHIFDFTQTFDEAGESALVIHNTFDISHLETNAVVVYMIEYYEMNNDGEFIVDENTFSVIEYFAYDVKLDIKLTEMLDDYCAICQDLNRVHMISTALLRWNLLKSFQNLSDINNCIEIYNDLTRIVNQDDDCTRCCRINSCNKDCTNPCNICINGSCSIN